MASPGANTSLSDTEVLPSPSVPSLRLRLFQNGGQQRDALCEMFGSNRTPATATAKDTGDDAAQTQASRSRGPRRSDRQKQSPVRIAATAAGPPTRGRAPAGGRRSTRSGQAPRAARRTRPSAALRRAHERTPWGCSTCTEQNGAADETCRFCGARAQFVDLISPARAR